MTEHKDKPELEDIDCLEAIDLLYAYLDGELDDTSDVNKFEHHLGHCRSCYSRSELEGLLNERIRESGKQEAPPALRGKMRKVLDEL